MVNTITCPKCNREFPLSDGLTHEFEERIRASLSEKHKKELIEALQREREQIGVNPSHQTTPKVNI